MNDFTSPRRSSSCFNNSADVFGSAVPLCDVGVDACAGGDWTGGLTRLAEPTDVTGGRGVVEADVKD